MRGVRLQPVHSDRRQKGRKKLRFDMLVLSLQPEERAMILVIREGLYLPGYEINPILVRLMALGMLDADEKGHPKITPLAEAALKPRAGCIH